MISLPFLSPKSLKSKASCNNSKKKREYCTICLFRIRGKKIGFASLERGCLLVYFLYLTLLNIFSFITRRLFIFPLRVLKLKHSFNNLFSLQQIHLKLILWVTALFAHSVIDITKRLP